MQPDVEIFDKNDDVLNRNEFSILLAKSIMAYNHEDPLTIGIMGSWGAGKSSLINLVENNLKKEKYIIIRFNPWFFSNQDNLYLQFFKLIISELKTKDIETQNIFERKIKPKRKIFKKSDDYLKEYFNYIKDSSLDFNIDNLYYSDHLESYDSLQFHKKQCEKYFSELGSKIIVIIDDIDRLMDTEIIQIFTLVKSLADFKHFIYILSFDKLIVTEALNGNSNYKDNFIDKIIQIPINVPHISESKMDELIDLNIGTIYKEQLGKNFKDYNNNFNQIFEYLKLFIKDIRDLKRYMNLLNFYKDNFSDELNINDFYLMLAVQLFEYQLYVKIKNSQEIITMDYYLKNIHCLVEEEREYNEFKQFINSSYNKYQSLLIFLFPILDIENISLSSDLYDLYYNEHKICIDNYFEKYFTLSLENNEASDIMVNELIKINDIEEICEIFKRRNNLEYNHSLVSKFSKNISEIPKDNQEAFIKSIMKCGDEINLYISTRKYIVQILNDLFAEIESEDSRLRLLEECIDYPNNVLTLSEFVYSLKNNKLLNDKNNLNKVTNSTIDKIRKCSDDNNFLNMEFLQNMLFYWKQLDDENYVKRYVLDNVKSDDEVISFLSKFRTKAESPFYIIGGGSSAHLVLDLDELNTYHGLEFYEKVVNKKLNEERVDDETIELCQMFLKQFEEYKIIKMINS